MEKWKTLQYNGRAYRKYEVSSLGRLRRKPSGELCKVHKNSFGYIGYYMPLEAGEDKRKYIKLHRAVACSFLQNEKQLSDVNHRDGDKTNNSVDNLEWVCHRDNMVHARRKGLFKAQSGRPRKLQPDDIQYIRKNPDGLSNYMLAKMFGVCKKTMKDIRACKTYRDIA